MSHTVTCQHGSDQLVSFCAVDMGTGSGWFKALPRSPAGLWPTTAPFLRANGNKWDALHPAPGQDPDLDPDPNAVSPMSKEAPSGPCLSWPAQLADDSGRCYRKGNSMRQAPKDSGWLEQDGALGQTKGSIRAWSV